MRKILFASMIIIFMKQSFGQQHHKNYQNILPASAEVASFAKSVDMPMNYSSGLPQISIPIYNFKHGAIEIPISLSYNSCGIRVEEVATWVGLGWNLSTGPTMVRAVRGLPDDCSYGYINSASSRKVKYVDALPIDWNSPNQVEYSERWFIENVLYKQNQIDLEPDIFTFSAFGYSGKFYWDQDDNKFVCVPFQNIKIEASQSFQNNIIKDFVITLPNGIKCYFGGTSNKQEVSNQTENFSEVNGYPLVQTLSPTSNTITSWAIDKVVDPSNNTINFNYAAVRDFVKEFGRGEEAKKWVNPDYTTDGPNSVFFQNSSSTFKQTFYKPVLESITALGVTGGVYFNRSNNLREDVYYPYDAARVLDNIQIKDQSNNPINKFSFNYYYTTSADGVNLYGLLDCNPFAQKRLWLNEVKQINNGVANLPYHFDYDTTPLPNRLSASQDYWGFYNGANNGFSLFPKIRQYSPQVNSFIVYNYEGANRNVDKNLCQAGILTKVTYPTGGTTSYTYESNTIAKEWYREKLGFIEPDLIDRLKVFFPLTTSVAPYPTNYEDTFHVNDLATTISFAPILPLGCGTEANAVTCPYTFVITSLNNPSFTPIYFNTIGTFYKKLPNDIYKIQAIYTDVNTQPNFQINITWAEHSITSSTAIGPNSNVYNYTIGGLRIKKIVSKDGVGNQISRSFDYNKLNAPNISSGLLGGVPTHITNIYDINGVYLRSNFSSSSATPLSNDGQIVKYQDVTEYTDEFKSSLKTEYRFHVDFNFLDLLLGLHDGAPAQLNEWRNNILFQKKIYEKNSATSYRLLNEEFHYYGVFDRMDKLYGLYSEYQRKYYTASEWFLPTSTTTQNYSYENGITKQLSNTTYYYYNSKRLLSSSKTTNSRGDTIENKSYYPMDYDSGVANMNQLITKNIIQLPIKQEQLLNGNQKSGNLILYNDNGLPTNFFQYENINAIPPQPHNSNILLPNNYVSSYNVDYNDAGNVKQQQKIGDLPESYVWGYQGRYPVAKIIGKFYNEAVNQSGLDLTILNNSTSEAALRTELNKLRNLSGCFVTTYTYKPLVGITSETDPNGKTIYYEYDTFNRLKLIKDQDGKILKLYDYKYQALPNQ